MGVEVGFFLNLTRPNFVAESLPKRRKYGDAICPSLFASWTFQAQAKCKAVYEDDLAMSGDTGTVTNGAATVCRLEE